MPQLQTTATRFEFYLVWLALRRVARGAGNVAEPLRHAIALFLDRIDALLELDIDREHRREINEVLVELRGSSLVNGALRGTCSRLADLLGVVLSEPRVPLRRPKIDPAMYARLLQLALEIEQDESGEEMWAEQLAARANVALDRVHAAIARMLADGIAHLPAGDDDSRADAFCLNDPDEVEEILSTPDRDGRDGEERTGRALPGLADEAEPALPNAREVVVLHGRGTARTGFFFDLLRRLNLRPLAFDELTARSGSSSPSVREVVRSAFARAQAVIVLFTGDDLASIRTDPREAAGEAAPGPQPHLRVIFEAGVAIALHHARTVIVEVPPLRGLLDLAGVPIVRFSTGDADERHQLVRRLRAAGCMLDTVGNDWLSLEFPPVLR